MPVPATPGPTGRRRLGDLLVDSGLITAAQLSQALTAQQQRPGGRLRLGQVLVELKLADERDIALSLADQLGLPSVDLAKRTLPPDAVRSLPQAMSERHGVCVVEIRDDGKAVLAMTDPTNVVALDDARAMLRKDVVPVVGLESQIRDQLKRAWSLSADSAGIVAMTDQMTIDDVSESLDSARAVEDAPTVQLVNRILTEAVNLRASDVHIETQRDSLRVRFRIDGILRDVIVAPKGAAGSVISRIKIISGLDISERRVPQDGRTRIVVDRHEIDTRVSTLPSLHGEKVVIRLLTRGDDVPTLASLGFEPEQLTAFRHALSLPQGLILITGPTGSGKTNTLYAGIHAILDPEKNIVTLEDPVEVQLPGITQVQVNPKSGMTFQAGLRSVLRQDPDIVLVGEVRDAETSELALKAALTGHLVLTTLHTNSAVAALTRLIDMGADSFLVASSLVLAVAQRLVRRPCRACSAPYVPDEATLSLLGLSVADLAKGTPTKGVGCPDCAGTGYRGRTAVYEVLEVDSTMRKILVKDPTEATISAQAVEAGMQTLRASALRKAMAGQTTFEEVIRTTTSDRREGNACPACSRPTEHGMVACPWCATNLESAQCASCQRPIDDGWALCPWCRTAVPEQRRAPTMEA